MELGRLRPVLTGLPCPFLLPRGRYVSLLSSHDSLVDPCALRNQASLDPEFRTGADGPYSRPLVDLEVYRLQVTRIPVSEVTFHPHSHGDPAGRLFRWNGELYRGIRAPWVSFFSGLFQTGVVRRLVEQGLLIDTEPTDLSLEGFDLVVHHRSVPFVSYPEEWCALMLKDAGLRILELLAELSSHRLSLKDGHPWNVVFENGRFVYVDLTSLVPAGHNGEWPGYDSFCRFCLYPLMLMSQGQERIARRLLPELDGVRQVDVERLTADSQRVSASSGAGRLRSMLPERVARAYRRRLEPTLRSMLPFLPARPATRRGGRRSLDALRQQIERIELPDHSPGTGEQPGSHSMPGLEARREGREQSIFRILSDLQPGTVLDMSSSNGWCSRLAACSNSQVVAFDAHPELVTRLYHEVRRTKSPILPLVMDFTDPTPARGLFGHWAIAASDRFKCDLVIALDLVRRVALDRHLDFAHIAGGLALFSNRWLLVEFMPHDTLAPGGSTLQPRPWYTLENFSAALGRHFGKVSNVLHGPEERVLLLCEK